MINGLKKRWGLTVSLVLFVFIIMMSAMLISGGIIMGLHFIGVLSLLDGQTSEQVNGFAPLRGILAMMVFSSFLGTAIAGFFSKKALKPIRKVIEAIHRVAEGEFDVKVQLKGIYELEELSRSFNKMTHELSSIETLRSDFINNVSHEFKTPIVSVRGFAKLLKDGELSDAERQEYLNIIITESERLAALSTNILSLSRYENLEIVADKTDYRLDEQIRRAVVLTEPKWAAKELDLSVEMEEVIITGNADLTQQIWLNLIDNAVKFTNPGGTITVRLALWNHGARFTIRDSGIGMDEQTQARIFDKFYQGDTSRAKAGNGLGLSIVKRIVELCGGSVEARSAQNEGSEFSVWLPMR